GLGAYPVGTEKRLAILFLDIRGFTSFSEHLLPYDVIHILRRFFARMGDVVERHGGAIENYMGDGMLAIFAPGERTSPTSRAVKAGLDMLDEAERMKPYERSVGGRSLEIGVGVHVGEVVTGVLGTRKDPRMTIIGDAVNMASRVENANKTTGTRFLISEPTYEEVRGVVRVGRTFTIALPGKTGMYTLYEIVGMAGVPETER
ncbi:MAG: adenylate/guanylate cyclase domain-containing protein, partial [Deltaproteobacteria bacterium]